MTGADRQITDPTALAPFVGTDRGLQPPPPTTTPQNLIDDGRGT